MGIDIYVSNHTLKKWFISILGEIESNHEFVVHSNLESLYSSIIDFNSRRVVIIDIEDKVSFEYVSSIIREFNHINLIALGLNKPVIEVLNYFKLGYKGFIDLDYSTFEVHQIISKVIAGSKFLSQNQQTHFLNYLSDNPDLILFDTLCNASNGIKYAIKSLTEKEKRVCELLIKGMSYKEIANAIGVTSFTINQRVKGIYKKLDVRSRGELSFRYLA